MLVGSSRHRGAPTLIKVSPSQLQLLFICSGVGSKVVLVTPHVATVLLLGLSIALEPGTSGCVACELGISQRFSIGVADEPLSVTFLKYLCQEFKESKLICERDECNGGNGQKVE